MLGREPCSSSFVAFSPHPTRSLRAALACAAGALAAFIVLAASGPASAADGLLSPGSLAFPALGLALIGLALVLALADLAAGGLGVLAALGLVSFAFGNILLFTPYRPVSASAADVVLGPWLAAGAGAALVGASAWLLRVVAKARRGVALMGPEALIGRVGVAVSELSPDGIVRIEGELWSAHAGAAPVRAGEEVQVVRAEGVTLEVIRG